MGLERLSPELVSLILQNAESPCALHDMISASSIFLRVFSERPHLILSSVVQNALPDDNLTHFLAARQTPLPATRNTVSEFLDKYFDPAYSFDFPTKKEDLVLLCQLYNRVTFLISCYAEYMQWLGLAESILVLSPTERIRLQRAFLRFEIYSRVFPPENNSLCENLLPNDQFCSAEQFDLFLTFLSPWEVEEMACVELYFTLMIRDCIDELENQFICAASMYADSSSAKSETEIEADSLVGFAALEQTSLGLFSKQGRYHSLDNISYMTSLGLDFIYNVCSPGQGRSELIRSNCIYTREFLPAALRHSPTWPPDHQYEAIASLEDNWPCSNSNLGYLIFGRDEGDDRIYKPVTSTGNLLSGIRQLGYVFWDSERILSPGVYNKLEDARLKFWQDITFQFDPGARRGAEDLLAYVKVRRDQMQKLERDFGYIS
jgi:hypothetical protein